LLLGNYSVLNKHPGRDIGGGAIGLGMNRMEWNKSSMARDVFSNPNWSKKSGAPDGYRPPYTWLIAQTAGGMASRNMSVGASTLTGTGAMGLNAVATLTGSGGFSPDPSMSLIVSAVAALAGTGGFTPDPTMTGNLYAAATLAGVSDVDGTVAALGWALADLTGTGAITDAAQHGTGYMAADVLPYSELSPQGLADAVWGASAAKLIRAVLQNKTVTDPDTGVMTVYDDDGETVLYEADVFEDADGTLPYSGSGVNRRERLA
jgi:hypothetical protein